MKYSYFLCIFIASIYGFDLNAQQDSLFVRKVGHWPYSTSYSVGYDSANNVAMVGSGQMMLLFNVADPAHPTKIGEIYLSGQNQRLTVSGHYAYMTDYCKGLDIIDISNPRSPVKTGFARTPGYAFGISVSGNFAYVGDGEMGLRIIDISDPFHPAEKGSYATTGFATYVAVRGNYAYLCDNGAGLRVIDISNPLRPEQIGFFSVPKIWGVALSGNYTIVEEGDGGNIRIIDVSNPYSPVEVSTINWNEPGYATQVMISGNYAYVCAEWPADPHVGIRIVDISDPFHPRAVGNISGLLSPNITVSGNHAFVSDWTDGFKIYDVSNPSSPNFLAIYDVPGNYVDVAISGKLAVLANPGRAHPELTTGFGDLVGLRVVNVSNPSSLTEVGFNQYNWGTARGVAVSGNFAYLASEFWGLRVFRIDSSNAPQEIGAVETPGNSARVVLSNNHAFMAAGYSGLRIIDISNPYSPVETGFYDTPGLASDVAISGNNAYVADGKHGIRIIDITDLSKPRETGFYVTPDSLISVAVSGNDLFAGSGDGFCIHRIEVSNPSAPVLKATLRLPDGKISRIVISGNYAYLAVWSKVGLHVIDISNPSSLIQAGYYNTNACGNGLTLCSSYIYLASEDNGMFILEFLKPPMVQLSTKDLSFGSVKLGQTKDTTVTISNSRIDTLRIDSITSTNTAFSIRPISHMIGQGQSFSDTLRFTPSTIGLSMGTILLYSNASSSPDIIKVSGSGSGTAALQLSRSSFSFGSVKVGQFKDTTVTIINNGNDTLKISNITSPSGSFLSRSTIRAIPPKQFFIDTLLFAPTTTGPISSIILVFSNAATSPDTIWVSGNAYLLNYLSVGNFTVNQGTAFQMPVEVSNEEAFVAFQFDLDFPTGLIPDFNGIQLSSRKQDHIFSALSLSASKLRVIAYSPTQKELSGKSGSIISIPFLGGNCTLHGAFTLNLINGILSNAKSENILYQSKNGSLNIIALQPVQEFVMICQGQNYCGWTTSGTYQRTLKTKYGCDSLVTTILKVNPIQNVSENKSICAGQSYNGWTSSGSYKRTLQTKTGCDSIVTTILTVNPMFNIAENKTICAGQNYQGWTTTGNYKRTLKSKSGCDSIVTTNLTVNPTYNITENKIICQGQSYNGWTKTGTYQRKLQSEYTCDSVVTTILKVNPLYNINENIYICQGENYNGWINSGSYKRTLHSVFGCDSIVSTDLIVFSSYNPIIIAHGDTLQAIRQYKTYQWYNESEVIAGATTEKYVIKKSGKYYMVIKDENGCTNTSEVYNAIYSNVRISKFEDFKYSIIPNPNTGQFTFRIDSNPVRDLTLKLVNPLGQVIEKRPVKSSGINHTELFDVAYLSKGIYYLIISSDSYQAVEKIVIQ